MRLSIKSLNAVRMAPQQHLIDLGDIGDHLFGAEIWIDVPPSIVAEFFSKLVVLQQFGDTVRKPDGVESLDQIARVIVNHDLAGYEVPVHADIPHQEVIFLDETDSMSSPMKAKGVGELGLCGVAAALANAVYNATGARTRDYPITLDRFLDRLPEMA